MLSAVIMVHGVDRARDALTEAYRELGLAFDPATVGCVADSVPEISVRQVREGVVAALAPALGLEVPLPRQSHVNGRSTATAAIAATA